MKNIPFLIMHHIDSLNVQEELSSVARKLSETPITTLTGDLLEKIITFGLKLFSAIIIYFIGIWLIKKIKNFAGRVFERKKTDSTVISFIQSIISIALTILLIIISIGAVGIDTTSIAALLAGGGMAIGMALNGTVQNFAGGIMLIIFKPFKAGDYILAQGYEGKVIEVNIVNTKLATNDYKTIIIPNGMLFNGTINNFSEQKFRRLEWPVNLEYGSSAEQIKEMLMSIIESDERIVNMSQGAPEDPMAAIESLCDSSVKYIVRGWVKSSDYWPVFFDINQKIYEELPKSGINFPFNQMDVHIHHNS